MRGLTEKGEKAKAAFDKYVQAHKDALEEERGRHRIYTEGINEQYNGFKEKNKMCRRK